MTTKICNRCHIEKPIEMFARATACKLGFRGECKICKSIEANNYYQRNREKVNAKIKEYHSTGAGKNTRAKSLRTARDKRRKEYAAYAKVVNALRAGTLIRPIECSSCGIECTPHGHHEDYDKPLDVIWLCNGCHLKVHGKKPLLIII